MQPPGQQNGLTDEHSTQSETTQCWRTGWAAGREASTFLENERLISLQGRSVFENGSDTEDVESRGGERNQGLQEEALEYLRQTSRGSDLLGEFSSYITQ